MVLQIPRYSVKDQRSGYEFLVWAERRGSDRVGREREGPAW